MSPIFFKHGLDVLDTLRVKFGGAHDVQSEFGARAHFFSSPRAHRVGRVCIGLAAVSRALDFVQCCLK